MRPTITDRVSCSVDRSVGLSLTLVTPAKTAESIEMPFGLRTLMGQNHALDGGQHLPREEAIFRGKGRPVLKYRDALP